MFFANERKHKISVPSVNEAGEPVDIAFLVRWICDNLMKDPRKEFFVLDDTV